MEIQCNYPHFGKFPNARDYCPILSKSPILSPGPNPNLKAYPTNLSHPTMNSKSAAHRGMERGPRSQIFLYYFQPDYPISGLNSQTGDFPPGWLASHTRARGEALMQARTRARRWT